MIYNILVINTDGSILELLGSTTNQTSAIEFAKSFATHFPMKIAMSHDESFRLDGTKHIYIKKHGQTAGQVFGEKFGHLTNVFCSVC